MPYALNLFDWILFGLLVVGLPVRGVYTYRRLQQRLPGAPAARLAQYRKTAASMWISALLVLALWLGLSRAPAELGLGWPTERPWFWLLLAAAAAMSGWLFWQGDRVLESAQSRQNVAERFERYRAILPASRHELHAFYALSATAGVCEEILYRGFVLWVLEQALGLWPAVGVSSILFGLGHIYQGVRGIVPTTVFGLVAALLYLGAGALWPAVLLHAAVDAASGRLAYRLLAEPSQAE